MKNRAWQIPDKFRNIELTTSHTQQTEIETEREKNSNTWSVNHVLTNKP